MYVKLPPFGTNISKTLVKLIYSHNEWVSFEVPKNRAELTMCFIRLRERYEFDVRYTINHQTYILEKDCPEVDTSKNNLSNQILERLRDEGTFNFGIINTSTRYYVFKKFQEQGIKIKRDRAYLAKLVASDEKMLNIFKEYAQQATERAK